MRGRAVVLGALAFAAGACLWPPDLARHGYVPCEQDADCPAGRSCEAQLCAPPPWHDPAFAARQLFVVENPAETSLPAGAAIGIRIGAGGLITSQELGVDGRFVTFEPGTQRWRVLPVFRDVYEDHLWLYVPTSHVIPPGGSGALAWLETQTAERQPTLYESPEDVFTSFDDFVGDELSSERYRAFGTGTPQVSGGRVRIADNQRLVGRIPLVPPFALQARLQVNGANCQRFFFGVSAGDGVSYEAPSAGFFATSALSVVAEAAPTADAVPRPVSEGIPVSTAEHRFRIDVGGGRLRFWLDDEVVSAPSLRPAFADGALYLRIEVDGSCSLEVSRLWWSVQPVEAPRLRAEPRVEYQIYR